MDERNCTSHPGRFTLKPVVQPAKRATYQDVLDAPDGMVAELIGGELYLQPRPVRSHARAAGELYGLLYGAYRRGRDGPDGWVFMFEPEFHLGEDVLVPDLAGWRKESTPKFDWGAHVTHEIVRPDWVCEVLSKSTERKDREKKLPRYTRAGVGHVWLLDPRSRILEVYRRGERVLELDEEAPPRAEPFDALDLTPHIRDLWR